MGNIWLLLTSVLATVLLLHLTKEVQVQVEDSRSAKHHRIRRLVTPRSKRNVRSRHGTILTAQGRYKTNCSPDVAHACSCCILHSQCGRKHYDNVSATDNALVHLGDVYGPVQYHTHAYVIQNPYRLFETMSSYRPWAYTMQELFPQLCPYTGWQCTVVEDWKFIQFYVLVSVASNRLIRTLITLIVPADSALGHFMSLDSCTRSTTRAQPRTLLAKVYDVLVSECTLSDDCHVALSATEQQKDFDSQKHRHEIMNMAHVAREFRLNLQRLPEQLSLYDVPWYSERELDYRPFLRGRQTARFFVYIQAEQRWGLGTKFRFHNQCFEDDSHSLKIIRMMNGHPGFAKFRGVIRDGSGLISGFINSIPLNGRFNRIFRDAIQSKSPVILCRRLKWCRQLIHSVAAAHENNLALGLLAQSRESPFGLDSQDNLVLFTNFQKKLKRGNDVPPECRRSGSETLATRATDVYHLGLILWRIAGHCIGNSKAELCQAAGCGLGSNKICLENHLDNASLPMSGDNYPEYLRAIITHCREPNVRKRLHASELVSMLPQDNQSLFEHTLDVSPQIDIESCQKRHGSAMSCDHCHQPCDDDFLHCSICELSNFDICAQCFFERRLHCLDATHSLRRSSIHDTIDKCYSSVDNDGGRNELTLDGLVVKKVA